MKIVKIKDKKYRIILELGRDPETGKRKRTYRTVNCTKPEAEKIMADMVSAIKKGTFVEPHKLTLKEYLENWLESYVATYLAPTTQRRYKQIINLRVNPRLGNIKLTQLKPYHLQNFFLDLVQEKKENGDTLSDASVKYHQRVIHKALDSAVKQQLIAINPADYIEIPSKAKALNEIEVFTPEEIEIILAESGKYYPLLFLAVRTGMRRGELLGLKWEDISFADKTLNVNRSLSYTPSEGTFFKSTKNKKSRTLDISDSVIHVLKNNKIKQNEYKLFLGSRYKDNNLIFCQDTGQPMHPDTISKWFPNYLGKLNLKRRPFHSLRHTFASLMLKSGVDIKIISEMLGHSSIRITYDVYSHLLPGQQRDAIDKFERLFN